MAYPRTVTQQEFEQFIGSYPTELKTDVVTFVEPPVRTFNDFSTGQVWPESVRASISLGAGYGRADNYRIHDLAEPAAK